MTRLPRTLTAWGQPDFAAVLADEVRQLGQVLPLCALATTGHPLAGRLAVSLLAVESHDDTLSIRLGVFFDEALPGCSCGDEAEPQPAYGELDLTLLRNGALAHFTPRDDR